MVFTVEEMREWYDNWSRSFMWLYEHQWETDAMHWYPEDET